MSGHKDLTRWNRAGQTRFTYVDGNAAEYLEILRQELAARFTDADWLEPHEVEPVNEKRVTNTTLPEEQKRRYTRAQRIVQMYEQERRDWGWEISRTFARASHILTGYADAWVNEGYLGTATQWDNVRRLVGLLGYYPAPPASATTPLVLIAKKGMSGLVRKGFQVKNSPLAGADKVLFETLDDLFVDEALNGMRPAGWDKSERPAIEDPEGSAKHNCSELARLPVINIQDIGSIFQAALEGQGISRISDFYDVDPESLTDSGIGITRLWEFKARAMTICNFRPGSGWEKISDWYLSDIVLEDTASLAALTKNSLESCEALQAGIVLLGACLDQSVYQQATMAWLQAPLSATETDYVSPKRTTEPRGSNAKRDFSELANLPVINIQAVGSVYQAALEGQGISRISDFYDVDPESLIDSGIGITRLWEFKARAMTICNFRPGSGWEKLSDWYLPDIVFEDTASLAVLTEKSLESCEALQVSIALLGACLDQPAYRQATLARLQRPPLMTETGYVLSPWRAGKKPKVEPGQVALVYHQGDDRAEAVTIAGVDANSKDIRLLSGPLEYSWYEWPLGEAVLRVVPRWTRKSWLNGSDVVRTAEAHGLTAGAYICWKDENDSSQYRYAKVSEADKKSLRLEPGGKSPMPYAGAAIMVALPIGTNIMSADYLALNTDTAGVDVEGVELNIQGDQPPFLVHKIFSVEGSGGGGGGGGGGGLLPPASLPGLGSFLFPSPFLPIDLVKAAIEMMLNLGIMVIPSTGEPVFKGLPFNGLLQGAPDIASAAEKMLELLDTLTLPAEWNSTGFLVNTEGDPAYLEAVCVPGKLIDTSRNYIDSTGALVNGPGLSCSNGKLVDSKNSPVGVQPHYSDMGIPAPVPGTPFQAVVWDAGVSDKKEEMQTLLGGGEDASTPTILFQGIAKKDADEEDVPPLPEPLLAVLNGESVVRGTVVPDAPVYLFDGVADKLDSGDWIVGAFEAGVKALRIKTIEDYSGDGIEKAFSLRFDELPGSAGNLEKIHADFRGELVAKGADINTTEITGDIELAPVPDALAIGQKVLLAGDGKVLAARITAIDGNTITTDPPATGFTKGGLVVYGNVVDASHGVSKPVVILGSGNAAKSNQTFVLEVTDVTFTPDANMSSGVAAAIDVEVAGRIWEQVSTLKDSTAGDPHYAIRMTEEGYVKILFGDGQNGRRLPTGKNNVKVRYRVGSGLSGNLLAYSLDKAVKQNPVIDSVLQPAPAAGGGDMESARSMRDNAPSTLLTLERAVSLSDFAHLATGRSNIWQANARSEIIGASPMEQVVVTVVPAGGAWSEDIQDDVTRFLQAHALPGVVVTVENFEAVTGFEMTITLRVNSAAYLPDDIIKAVQTALVTHFSLERARLGVSLYLSEVYKLVESVEGVENSICRLIRDGQTTQLVRSSKASEVIFLDADNLTVEWEEYLP